MLRNGSFDIALVDLDLPGSGEEACRQLRDASAHLGIIAFREGGTKEDDQRALEAGADDSVTLPLRYREMVARMSVVRRRIRRATASFSTVFRADQLELDLERRIVLRQGKPIHLSRGEFNLLAVLMTNAGVALPHQRLVWSAWGGNSRHNRAYLRTYIKSLRQKIEDDPAAPRYILTEPWVGYLFCGGCGSE